MAGGVGAILSFFGGTVAGSLMGSALAPINYQISKWIWDHIHGRIPNEMILAQNYMRGFLSKDKFYSWMSQLGYDKEMSDQILSSFKQLQDVTTLLQLYSRGIIDENEYYNRMSKLGFSKKEAEEILGIAWQVPSASDLINMAVKEAFNEQASKELMLDDDLENTWNQLKSWARKIFLNKNVFKYYWRSHWRLPSPEQVITMYNMFYPMILNAEIEPGKRYGEKYNKYIGDYHKIITDDELVDKYLKWYDISPIWRDRFKAMTYPPITRVDLRRIYQLGLINDKELLVRIMQLGYALEDAQKLVEFYKQYKLRTEKTLTKSEIQKAYMARLITRNQAEKALERLGYSRDEAEFYIKFWEFLKHNKEIYGQIRAYVKAYVIGYLSLQDLNDKLNGLGLPSNAIQDIINQAQVLKMERLKLPSKSEVLRWFKLGMIKRETALQLLEQIGYPTHVAKMYLIEAQTYKSEKAKLPSKEDIKQFLRYKIIDENKARELLRQNGYSEEIINYYIKLWGSG